MKLPIQRYLFILFSIGLLQACVIRVNAGGPSGDVSKVFGGIELDTGTRVGMDVSTVNGRIEVSGTESRSSLANS
ncbi:MAG: hypothetical protein WD002_02855 [Pseudomonadales bacterium]